MAIVASGESIPAEMDVIQTFVKKNGLTLELSLARRPTPRVKKPNHIVIRVEAAPINPSDLGVLFGVSNVTAAQQEGPEKISIPIPPKLAGFMQSRVGRKMQCGNEGAGVVVEAGSDPNAQRLLGKTVAVMGGKMYAQYRRCAASSVLVLHSGTTAREGASCFVNPMTVLGMLGTMKAEGHSALVHTAAASNLGQMLQKACIMDGIPLVNVVRKQEQEDILLNIGATYVVNSSKPSFMTDLVAALTATNATLAFDATGGGKLASDILTAMERAQQALSSGTHFSNYGSDVHKQLYIYGGLDRSPTILTRGYGMSWGMGGWLLPNYFKKFPEQVVPMRKRVAKEISTTFSSKYVAEVSLSEAVSLQAVMKYAQQKTGQKYLVNPQKRTTARL